MLVVPTLIVVCIISYIIYVVRIRIKYPAGPLPWPIFGNLLQLDPDAPHRTIHAWSQRYGPVFTIFIPKAMVIIADYELIQEALLRKGDALSGRYIGFVFGQLAPDPFGCGIILCEGPKWREQRRFTMSVLRELGLNKHAMEDRVMQQVEILTHRIRVRRQKWFSRGQWIINTIFKLHPNGRQPDLGKRTMRRSEKQSVMDLDIPLHLCVVNIINAVVMGTTWREDDPRFFHLKTMISQQIRNVQSVGMLFLDAYPWLRHLPVPGKFGLTEYSSNQAELSRFFMRQVVEHEQLVKEASTGIVDETDDDLATAYLKEIEKRKKAGQSTSWFDNWQLMIILGDLWAAGMETTVSTLRWAILYLIHYPEVQANVRQEIKANIGERPLTYADRRSLPYTMATILEIQRVGNIVPVNIPHRTLQDLEIGGHRISAGSTVVPQISSVHLNANIFPDPDVFQPNRFLVCNSVAGMDGTVEITERINTDLADRVIPFSLGKRQCLGEGLARMELFLILTSLIQRFEFEVVPDSQPPSLKPIVGITMSPEPYYCAVKEVTLDTIHENEEYTVIPEKKPDSFYTLDQ